MAKMKYIELSPDYRVPLIEVPEDYTKEQVDAHLKSQGVHQNLPATSPLHSQGQ